MRSDLPNFYDPASLLALHRTIFGEARMEDPAPAPDLVPDPEADLNDAGKKALRAERERASKAEKAAAAAAKERDAHKVELDRLRTEGQTDAEKAIEKAREEARAAAKKEAADKANRRILTAEVKAAAGTKLNDPADAVRLLDLDEFTVNDDGDVDAKAISAAIDNLLRDKPYLAAKGSGKPQGDPGQGPRQSPPTEVLPGRARIAAAYASKSTK